MKLRSSPQNLRRATVLLALIMHSMLVTISPTHWRRYLAGLLALTSVVSRSRAQGDLNPTLVAQWPGFVRNAPRDMALLQKEASRYVCAACDYVLHIWDLTRPDRPRFVSFCALSPRTGESGAESIAVSGDYAHLTACRWEQPPYYGSLQIFRLRDVLALNPPVLSGNALTLSWSGGFSIKLQKTPSLSPAQWQDVPGSEGAGQIELPRNEATAFFRLIQP